MFYFSRPYFILCTELTGYIMEITSKLSEYFTFIQNTFVPQVICLSQRPCEYAV